MQYEVKLDILDIIYVRYLDLLSDPPLARPGRGGLACLLRLAAAATAAQQRLYGRRRSRVRRRGPGVRCPRRRQHGAVVPVAAAGQDLAC